MTKTREEIIQIIETQFNQVKHLKKELHDIKKELNRELPKELVELKAEIEQLKKEQEELNKMQEALPPKYRVPAYFPLDEGEHLFLGQNLFPPPTEEEKLTGRVKYVPKEERVCHPAPFERPQNCRAQPLVLARVTVNLNEL